MDAGWLEILGGLIAALVLTVILLFSKSKHQKQTTVTDQKTHDQAQTVDDIIDQLKHKPPPGG